MISGGVCLASYGELHFNTFGFVVQALAVAVSLAFTVDRYTLLMQQTWKVRSFAASNDTALAARTQDGSSGFTTLLRARPCALSLL